MKISSLAIGLFAFIGASNYTKGQDISFSHPQDIAKESVAGVSALDVGDFNKDGLIDVAVMEGGAHSKGRVTFAWFEQTTNKTWIRHEFGSSEMFDDFIGSASCGDMDNDGNVDLVITNDGHSTGPITVYLFKNPGRKKVKGKWPFQEIATIDGFHANDMRLADIEPTEKWT